MEEFEFADWDCCDAHETAFPRGTNCRDCLRDIVSDLRGCTMITPPEINGTCKRCKEPVVFVTMMPADLTVSLRPCIEHGGNVEVSTVRGELVATVTGSDPKVRKMVLHSEDCWT